MKACSSIISLVLVSLQKEQVLSFQSNFNHHLHFRVTHHDQNLYATIKGNNQDNLDVITEQKLTINETDEQQSIVHSRRTFISSIVGGATATAVVWTAKPSLEVANAATDVSQSQTDSLDKFPTNTISEAAAVDFQSILQKSTRKALGGGKAGAAAAFCQVLTLMWLRTSMNYQYRYGGNLQSSLSTLYEEGGIPRLYQGLPFAIVQGPLTRFGDTAANVGILVLLESIPETASLPIFVKTFGGSCAAGLWRIFCMPIDTCKTVMQVEGSEGLTLLKSKVLDEGLGPLYRGSLASAAATAAGHYPWYLTFNFLNDALPVVDSKESLLISLGRYAFLGLCSSCVSDCVSNSLRVIKTTKQTSVEDITYKEALTLVLDQDGVAGLFGRGLQTRLLTNMIQGAVFSVLWKYFQTTMQ